MATIDRRDRKRIPANFKVDFIHDEDYIISFSKNISADGMFIHTEKPPKVGRRVALNFSVDGIKKFRLDASVVWVNRSGNQKDFGMGVRFIKPSTALRQDLLKAVNKVAVLSGMAS